MATIDANQTGILDALSGGNQGEEDQAAQDAVGTWQGITAPTAAQLQINPNQIQQYGVAGSYQPATEQTINQGANALGSISTDPALQQAQYQALASLQNIGQGGLTATDKANLAQIQQTNNAQSAGQQQAILQRAQETGTGGSGAALAQELEAQQGQAQNQSAQDQTVAGQAQARALAALQGAGSQAAGMQSTQFGQQAQVAAAQNAINQFNAANAQGVAGANTQAANTAQQYNLNNQQQVSNANVGQNNQLAYYNAQAPQTAYQDATQLAAGQSGADLNAANIYGQLGSQNLGFEGGIYNTIGNTAGAAFGAMMSDENLKTDMSSFDPSEFLDSIVPTKFKYKSPKHGVGEHYGVVAQDLEKTPMGKSLIVELDDGKGVDVKRGFGALLASVGNLNDRMKKIEGGK